MAQQQADILKQLNGLFIKKLVLQRGDYLKKANTADTNIYLVEKGSLIIFIMDGDEERIVRFGYDGNIVVSLDSFLNEQPSGLYIQAIKRTQLRVASKKAFRQFADQSPQYWITVLEDLVLQQMEREKDLLIQSPAERYRRVLERSPLLFQHIPNKYIAAYLRMSAETLSRLKKP